MTAKDAKSQLSKQLTSGERAVYFTNHTPSLSAFCKDTSINPDVVAVPFSDQEKRDTLAKEEPTAFQRMEQVEDAIAIHNRIPDDIRL